MYLKNNHINITIKNIVVDEKLEDSCFCMSLFSTVEFL